MADNGTGSRKLPSIPSWQQAPATTTDPNSPQPEPAEAKDAPARSDLDPVEQARIFLQNDEVKNASREEKVEFLQKKGLQADDIQALLDAEEATSSPSTTNADMQTIFDSTNSNAPISTPPPSISPSEPAATTTPPPPPQAPPSMATLTPKQDLPPIITYPEFRLKPQKPPPLVTIDRLVNAGYVLAGVSALTWGASRYLVAPMLEALTSARRDLQSTTLTSLQTLNQKLESSVSHVPYIPPLSHKHSNPITDNDDAHSTTTDDSDPTELFHRDIATQTSPPTLSRRSSTSSTASRTTLGNATTTQSRHLQSLHSSLSSLLSSTNTTFSTSSLNDSLVELQDVIDKIESNSQPLYTAYDWKTAGATGVTSAWNATSTGVGSTAGTSVRHNKPIEAQSEAAKFKAEIRSLKGAFLSSRNFPTARPVAPSAAGGR